VQQILLQLHGHLHHHQILYLEDLNHALLHPHYFLDLILHNLLLLDKLLDLFVPNQDYHHLHQIRLDYLYPVLMDHLVL
jgi:hypothetical protein